VSPSRLGPYRFQSTRIDYWPEGLAGSEALRLRLLDGCGLDHQSHRQQPAPPITSGDLAAHRRSRSGAAGDEDAERFVAALPRR
jgi:hypothetical protein